MRAIASNACLGDDQPPLNGLERGCEGGCKWVDFLRKNGRLQSTTAMRALVRNGLRRQSGQVMTEFVMVAGVTIMFFFILAIFLNAYLENQYRVLTLLSSPYP